MTSTAVPDSPTASDQVPDPGPPGDRQLPVSVLIPITGQDSDPARLVEGFGAALAAAGYRHEFVFVLDGIGGAKADALEKLAAAEPSIPADSPPELRSRVRVVHMQGGGLGEPIALSAGMARATGKLIVNAPQYIQAEPEDLVKVVQALEGGADCVTTWRHPRVDPWLNQLQSRFFNWSLRLLMGIPFHDLNSSLRGFRRQVLDEVNVYGELFRFLPVLALRQGFRVVEVTVRHREEQGRHGFYGVGVYVRRLLDILAISFLTRFTQKPLRFFGMLGLASILIGIALMAFPLYEKLVEGFAIRDKPAFVVGSIVAIFGVQLIGFGLVGEIIIFTQASGMRDYRVSEDSGPPKGHLDGALAQADVSDSPLDAIDPNDSGGPADGAATAGLPTMEEALPDSLRALHDPILESPEVQARLPMRVRELLPGEDARWDAFVRRHPLGTFFHQTGWRRVVAERFKHEAHYLVLEQGRTWLGVLPLMFAKSPFTGANLISVPYAVYGGALVDDATQHQALLDAAVDLGATLDAGFVELRQLEPRPGERAGSDLYVTFRCELPEDPAEVMPRIPKKARAEVRRARDKHGITFGELPANQLREFYQLFAANKHALGSPIMPFAWFHGLVEEFGPNLVVHMARTADGEPLCAVMSFLFGDTVYAYYSGARRQTYKTGVNDFIYCRIMEWAVERGYRHFDFGRSRKGSGPASFKKNMGFTAEPLAYEYLLLKDSAKMPEFHPGNPKLSLPRKVWTKIPRLMVDPIGARLTKYLP